MRREGDSNPRYAFGVYTLSRRASSTTRAPLLKRIYFDFCYKCILFFLLQKHYPSFIYKNGHKLIYFKISKSIFVQVKHLQTVL